MSVLLIDAGNTRYEWRYLSGDKLQHGWSNYQQLQFAWPEPVDRCVVACVTLNPIFKELLIKKYDSKVHWLEHPMSDYPDFQHCYQKPERLGVDRWLAMLGARKYTQQPVLVVDAGTALTLDVLDQQNHHLGGYIVPGLRMAEHALFKSADKVRPYDDEEKTTIDTDLGQDTVSCVLHGLLLQRLGLIKETHQQHSECQIMVTGGDGESLAKQLQAPYYRNLVLDGMEILCAGYL